MSEITLLLHAAAGGDLEARNELFQVVYDELREAARWALRNEAAEHTLQPTALVHEVYMRMFTGSDAQAGSPAWDGRRHFYGAAANAMRQILVDVARRKVAKKRGGERTRVVLELGDLAAPQTAEEILSLDEALTTMEASQPRVAELVRLRFFAGLTINEAAAQLGVAPRTADKDWAYARAWLLAEIRD